MKKPPKVVYVRWNDNGRDEPWLEATEDMNDWAEVNEKHVIGRYELVEIGTVEAVPKYLRASR